MQASELFKAGQLDQAIAAQIEEVRKTPADHARRLFLFELLSFACEWDRAERQVQAIQTNELELDAALLNYKKLVEAERTRQRVFSEAVRPQFLQAPPPHAELRLQALLRLVEKRPAEAAELLAQADEQTPSIEGTWNKLPCAGLRDCDDLLSGIVEVMAHGDYYWVPWEQIELIACNPPSTPRDLIWRPVRLETREAASGDAFIPTRYPQTWQTTDVALKLCRATDWLGDDSSLVPGQSGPVQGLGAKMVLFGDQEDAIAWLDLTELVIDSAS